MDDVVDSPCTNVCVVDQNGCCVGCFRDLDEIADWGSASNDRKREILECCRLRRERSRSETD
ncbi:MAG: DUF1289 domain-containing protein [Pirellulaceae bacterium]|nr:DUF1289 domain-containing protein [Pirellulaceae bacterium]